MKKKMASAARRRKEVLDRCEEKTGRRELKRSKRAVEKEEEKKKKEEEKKEREEEWVLRRYPRLEEDGDIVVHVQKLGPWFPM